MDEVAGIMLVEDHLLFRQALAVLLDGEPDLRVVAQAGSLAEARERAAASREVVRLAVLDIVLPDGDATELIAELKRLLPEAKVLILTASLDPNTATRALKAGADATMNKVASKGEILTAVRAVLKR